jgi:hypothetical protein
VGTHTAAHYSVASEGVLDIAAAAIGPVQEAPDIAVHYHLAFFQTIFGKDLTISSSQWK